MTSEDIGIKRSQLVVKDNDLIQKANYALNATQQKFIAYLISMIKPTDTELKEYTVRVEDFCAIAGIDKAYFYSEFIAMIDSIDNKNFWVETEDVLYKFYWFSKACYIKGKGEIKITLSEQLAHYLIGLSESFTQYELYNILALKSKYAIRLFELFKSYAYQKTKEFDVDELKELLQATNYTNFKDFRARVLNPAIKEINEYTELEVDYAEKKCGRRIAKIVFFINQKEKMETLAGYIKTMRKLDEENGQVEGQISMDDIFDV